MRGVAQSSQEIMRLRIPPQVPTQPARLLQLTIVSLGHLLPRSQVDELPTAILPQKQEEMIERNFFQEVCLKTTSTLPQEGERTQISH